ncbi:MAG: hypothetical protein GWN67_01280 [Phycisphaerae bacterium]|nr:hypothetical protein [Phycisphaerae bacterium]NIP50590.1 hypothetical protein [Phycisphaerae bacterium]NIS50801.1 hypothetical protein [Phycisphaerae bacterium]NIU07478.1 hypothetical protein [Phycisphaerae bacterium]NIU55068.1 hypothetical protein [Phycisphaerae bacterium]
MRVTKYTTFLLVIVTVLVVSSGCATVMRDQKFASNRKKVEKNTPPFDPAYFRQADRKHLAIFFEVKDGRLVLSDRPAQVRPARMPYRSPTTGDVVVVYRDAGGKQIGRYAISDPVVARSCDVDKGRKGAVARLQKGTVEILVPYDPEISTVEIAPKEGKFTSFKVGARIKSGLRLTN